MNIHLRNLPRVVIVGGGFGGLEAAKALRKVPVRVTLLDRQNHHLFQPLLYQVATAALSPADIAEPLRHDPAPAGKLPRSFSRTCSGSIRRARS